MKIKKIELVVLLILSLGGFILTYAEYTHVLNGKSVCLQEGCQAVGSFVRNIKLLYLAGLSLFASVSTLSVIKNFVSGAGLLLDILLLVALVVEGYLVGFQLFVVEEICQFCITVAGIIVLIGLTRFAFRKGLIPAVGILAFFVLIATVWLVNPGIKPLPSREYILVYSESCHLCKDIINFCKNKICIKT